MLVLLQQMDGKDISVDSEEVIMVKYPGDGTVGTANIVIRTEILPDGRVAEQSVRVKGSVREVTELLLNARFPIVH